MSILIHSVPCMWPFRYKVTCTPADASSSLPLSSTSSSKWCPFYSFIFHLLIAAHSMKVSMLTTFAPQGKILVDSDAELTDRDAEGEDYPNDDPILSDSELTDRDADGVTDDGSFETVWSPSSDLSFHASTTTAIDTSHSSATDDCCTDEDGDGEHDDVNDQIVIPTGNKSYTFLSSGSEDDAEHLLPADGHQDEPEAEDNGESNNEVGDGGFASESEGYFGGDERDVDDNIESKFMPVNYSPCPELWRAPLKMIYLQGLSFNDFSE